MKEYPIDHNVLVAPIAHALLIGRPTYHQWCRTGALFGPVPVLSCGLVCDDEMAGNIGNDPQFRIATVSNGFPRARFDCATFDEIGAGTRCT